MQTKVPNTAPGIWPAYGILTNLNCNLNCTYCFEHSKSVRVNDIDHISSFLAECYRIDYEERHKPLCVTPIIDLIGGESFLYPGIIDQICEEAQRLNVLYGVKSRFIVSISTNGTMLTDSSSQNVVTKWKNNLNLGFSIDGTKANHDACRVDCNGHGSYDRAVAGYLWAKNVLPPNRISVKATYTHKTMPCYADGVINLIKLGFTTISANVVFEEVWTPYDADLCSEQLIRVANYLLEHGLLDEVHVFQLNPHSENPWLFEPRRRTEKNWCGSCVYMRCLGFDGNIYGCHRFATSFLDRPIGRLEKGKIAITDQALIDQVKELYKHWPQECRDCEISGYCPSCAVAAFEACTEDPAQFYKTRPQCGWTIATVAARDYLKTVLNGERCK